MQTEPSFDTTRQFFGGQEPPRDFLPHLESIRRSLETVAPGLSDDLAFLVARQDAEGHVGIPGDNPSSLDLMYRRWDAPPNTRYDFEVRLRNSQNALCTLGIYLMGFRDRIRYQILGKAGEEPCSDANPLVPHEQIHGTLPLSASGDYTLGYLSRHLDSMEDREGNLLHFIQTVTREIKRLRAQLEQSALGRNAAA